MKSFDKVPVLDREYFEHVLPMVKSFAVWVQVNPARQHLVPISREDALEIVNDGLKFGYVWGQFTSDDGCLQISITSQWLSRLEDDRLQGDQDRGPC
jgi:hypothetical protein